MGTRQPKQGGSPGALRLVAHRAGLIVLLFAGMSFTGCGSPTERVGNAIAEDSETTQPGAIDEGPALSAAPESAFSVAAREAEEGSSDGSADTDETANTDEATNTDEAANKLDEAANTIDETSKPADEATDPTDSDSAKSVAAPGEFEGAKLEEPFDHTVVTVGPERSDGWWETSPDLPEDHGTLVFRPLMEPFSTGDYRYRFLETVPEGGAYGDASPWAATVYQDIDGLWTPVTGVDDGDLRYLLELYLEPGQVLGRPDVVEANEIGEHLVGIQLLVPVRDFMSGAEMGDIEVGCWMNTGRAPNCSAEDLAETQTVALDLAEEDSGVVTRLCSYWDPEADPDIFAEPSLDAEKKMDIGGPDCAFFVRRTNVDSPDGWVPIVYKTDATSVQGWVQRETVGTRREMVENGRVIREQYPRETLNPNATMLDPLSALDYIVAAVELPSDFGNVSDEARACLREVWDSRAEVLVAESSGSETSCNLIGDVTGECNAIVRFPDGLSTPVTITYTADNTDYPITHAGIDTVRFAAIPTSPECAF